MVDQCIVLTEGAGALVELCGISILERLLRTLQRSGFRYATILSSVPELIAEHISQPSWARAELKLAVRKLPSRVTAADLDEVWPEGEASLLLIRGDAILDTRLLRTLAIQNNTGALVDSAVPPNVKALVGSAPDTSVGKFCGAALLRRDWLVIQKGTLENALISGLEQGTVVAVDVDDVPLYYSPMRRKLRAFWFLAPAASQEKIAEQILLDATQKGLPDIPAWVHGPIERFLISYLCRTPITPNQLTILCNVVAWMTTGLFAFGHLIWGIGLALIVGVLDGLDGKQARIKVETTHAGKLEHWFDGLFEWSWWTALAYHLQTSGRLPDAFRYWFLLVVAEGIDGIAKGGVLFATGKLIDELNIFERIIRLVGGRRNVYVWILAIGILFGVAEKAFITMVWLEAITAAVHLPHAAWITYKAWRGPPRSS